MLLPEIIRRKMLLDWIKKRYSKPYQELDGPGFKQAFETSENAQLLDVRTPFEFRAGTLNGAKNLDVNSLDFSSLMQRLPKTKTYFLFCRSGARSRYACRLMAAHGFQVINLRGGIGEWPQ